MKRKNLILAITAVLITVMAVFGLVACDDNVDINNIDSSNGRGMVFDSGVTVDTLTEVDGNGKIQNYTVKAVTTKNDENDTITYYYVADGQYYWYYTYFSDNSMQFAGYSIDENFVYSIIYQPKNSVCRIDKYGRGSATYNETKRILSFNDEHHLGTLISRLTTRDDETVIKDFTVSGDKITWTQEISGFDHIHGTYMESTNATLYNVNSTEECKFPDEVKNYKELAAQH